MRPVTTAGQETSSTTGQALETASQLRQLRADLGRSDTDFTGLAPSTDAITRADYQRAEDGGVTHILTMPWMFHTGPNASTCEKIADMETFRKELRL